LIPSSLFLVKKDASCGPALPLYVPSRRHPPRTYFTFPPSCEFRVRSVIPTPLSPHVPSPPETVLPPPSSPFLCQHELVRPSFSPFAETSSLSTYAFTNGPTGHFAWWHPGSDSSSGRLYRVPSDMTMRACVKRRPHARRDTPEVPSLFRAWLLQARSFRWRPPKPRTSVPAEFFILPREDADIFFR